MMTTISSHTLNGTDGTHAGNVPVSLTCLLPSGERKIVFETATDDGGRLLQEVDLTGMPTDASYEMVFTTGPYWAQNIRDRTTPQIMNEIVVRFSIPDKTVKYHIPIIMNPNSYSVWWSS